MPYGCNDNIKGIGNLSSPGNSEVNVMNLFNTYPRQKGSHGKRQQKPRSEDPPDPHKSLSLKDSHTNLLSSLQQPLGVHHIRGLNFFRFPSPSLKVSEISPSTKEVSILFLLNTDCLVLFLM